jgi:hypothetical protein
MLMRLNGNGDWIVRLEYIGNRLIDPIAGNGGFKVLSYTLKGLAVFMECILARVQPGNGSWSIVEIDLEAHEREFILGLPGYVSQELLISASQDAPMIDICGQQFSPAEVFGSALLICETFWIRKESDGNQVNQTIESRQWTNQARSEWFVSEHLQPGVNTQHRDLIARAARRLCIRHAFDTPAIQHSCARTYLLQIGLSKKQWMSLIERSIPAQPLPQTYVVANDLYCENPLWHSASFKRTWDILREFQKGGISRTVAESELYESPWIDEDWIEDILEMAEGPARIVRRSNRRVEISGNSRDSFLSKPLLHWSNGEPFFCSAIDHAALSATCPIDCYALEITGPSGVMGEIARPKGDTQWHRVIGFGISQQMELHLPLTGLFSGEISIEIRSIQSKMDFSAQISLVLWHDDALISRYGSNGELHQDAWRKLLPAGESLSLLYPSGWAENIPPVCCADLADSGMRIARFERGWVPPIQIRDESGVIWWSSADLHAPSRSLPMELRDILATCVIDYRAAEHVTAHLKIHPHANLVLGVNINGEFKTLADLGGQSVLRIGGNQLPLQALWNGLSVKIKVAQNGMDYWFTRVATIDARCSDLPILIGKSSGGKIRRLSENGLIETAQEFRTTHFRALLPSVIDWIQVIQLGMELDRLTAQSASRLSSYNRGAPFEYQTIHHNGHLPKPLMPGVEERGNISKVSDFNILDGGLQFQIGLDHAVEPTLVTTNQSPCHSILILVQRDGVPGQRLCPLIVSGNNANISSTDAWKTWSVKLHGCDGNIIGVGISYGETLIGCWVKGGPNACQAILNAEDLSQGEIQLLATFIHWFHLPIFNPDFKPAVLTFYKRHAAYVLAVWSYADVLIWDQSRLKHRIQESGWPRVVCELANQALMDSQEPVQYNGICDASISVWSDSGYFPDREATDLWKYHSQGIIEELACFSPHAAACLALETAKFDPEYTWPLTAGVADDSNYIRLFDTYISGLNLGWQEKETYYSEPESFRARYNHPAFMHADDDWAELRMLLANKARADGALMDNLRMVDLWVNAAYAVNVALNNGVVLSNGETLDTRSLASLNGYLNYPAFCRLLTRKLIHPELVIPTP